MSDLLDSDLTPAEIIQQYQVREAVLVEAIEPIRKYIQAVADYDWPARQYPDSGMFHFNDVTVDRQQCEKLLAVLASLPQAVIPISDQDPEKLRAEGAEFLHSKTFEAYTGGGLRVQVVLLEDALESLSNQERID